MFLLNILEKKNFNFESIRLKLAVTGFRMHFRKDTNIFLTIKYLFLRKHVVIDFSEKTVEKETHVTD